MNLSKGGEWTKVKSRRHKSKIYPVDSWWVGFNKAGAENWYIKLSDGKILTSQHEDFSKWFKKC